MPILQLLLSSLICRPVCRIDHQFWNVQLGMLIKDLEHIEYLIGCWSVLINRSVSFKMTYLKCLRRLLSRSRFHDLDLSNCHWSTFLSVLKCSNWVAMKWKQETSISWRHLDYAGFWEKFWKRRFSVKWWSGFQVFTFPVEIKTGLIVRRFIQSH
jgi:hypothetical protein